jgi:hypothetical protein
MPDRSDLNHFIGRHTEGLRRFGARCLRTQPMRYFPKKAQLGGLLPSRARFRFTGHRQ